MFSPPRPEGTTGKPTEFADPASTRNQTIRTARPTGLSKIHAAADRLPSAFRHPGSPRRTSPLCGARSPAGGARHKRPCELPPSIRVAVQGQGCKGQSKKSEDRPSGLVEAAPSRRCYTRWRDETIPAWSHLPRPFGAHIRRAAAGAAARGAREAVRGRASPPQRHRRCRPQEVLGRAAWSGAGQVRRNRRGQAPQRSSVPAPAGADRREQRQHGQSSRLSRAGPARPRAETDCRRVRDGDQGGCLRRHAGCPLQRGPGRVHGVRQGPRTASGSS